MLFDDNTFFIPEVLIINHILLLDHSLMGKKPQKERHIRVADSQKRFMIESDDLYRDFPIVHEVCKRLNQFNYK